MEKGHKLNYKVSYTCFHNMLTSRECMFLIAIVLKMVAQTITISVIPTMIGQDLCAVFLKIVTYSSYLLIIGLIFSEKNITIREFIIIVVLLGITLVGSYFAGNEILLMLIYFYGAKSINIEKVFRYIGIIYIAIFLIIVCCSLTGIIENWDFFQLSSRPRWGLGYSYPTHTSSVLFMSILVFCYLKKEQMNILWVMLLELMNLWVYRYTDSRAGFALSAVAIIIFWLVKFRKKETTKSKIDWTLQWSFPVCAVVIFLMSILYKGTGILKIVNQLLSTRLSNTKNAIDQYGIHVFGQKIQWVGWGGWGHTQVQLRGEYNFVDTSYIKLLLDNGILVWIIIMLLWLATCIKAYKSNNRYLLYALSFLAIYCIVEQWLMNLGANPFVVFLAVGIFGSTTYSNVRTRPEIFLKKCVD